MKSGQSTKVIWTIVIIGVAALLILSANHFLFWDTVQFGSAHPDYYFNSNFTSFWLPADLDSGHPPFFGRYIAFCWKIFGRSLVVTHLSMWPVIIGIIWQTWRLGKRLVPHFPVVLLPLLLLEPVLLGQLTLVSPDLVLLFGFLLAMNEIHSTRKRFLVLAVIVLAMVSTRAMMVGLVLFIWWVWTKRTDSAAWKKLRYFIPGGIIGASFLMLHYWEFGWIGYHEGSSWADSFQTVGISGLLRNMVLVGIHLLDFGHIFIFGIITWTSYKYWPKVRENQQVKSFSKLLFLLALFLLPTLIMHQYLFNHRYLLPIFITLDALAIFMVASFWIRKKQGWSFIGAALMVGSLWVYPQPIATSWDCTIMHWGYYSSRSQLMDFIAQEKIPLDQIGTAFPNINSTKRIDLTNDDQSFVEKDLSEQQWVFYSNVMNDFTSEELAVLAEKFQLKKEFRSGWIKCQLLERKQ